ncbi:MAG: penicillin-binding protein activator [bacterium]
MQTIKTVFIFLCAAFSLINAPSLLRAQQSNKVQYVNEKEAEFRKALRYYRLENYRQAFAEFETLTNSQILHHRMTASLLMTGKSLYHLDKYSDATRYSDELINDFPQSKYVDDAYFLKASSYYRLNNAFSATRYFLWIADWSSDERLVDKAQRIANSIIRSQLSLSELNSLLPFANGETSAALVTLELARKELRNGSSKRAVALLNNYKKKFASGRFTNQIDQLLRQGENPGQIPVKVGVVLPLTGFFSEEGQGVYHGIKFANLQAKENAQTPVQLVVRDSQGNMIKAIQATRNLIYQENVRAIIGELESSITAGIGALAASENIPVIGPTATENEVASVGASVYQLNSDLERKGRVLAAYAFEKLGFRTFATLAPADAYGQQMTDSFTSMIDKLGGRIIAQSVYYDNTAKDLEDLSRQFTSIRQAAFSYDSTDVEQLIEEAEENGEKLEEKDIPVLSIDAIFLPVYSDHIQYVAPQFATSNIRAQILGGEYWDDIDVLTEGQIQPYVEGAIFVSDYFPDENNRAFRNFRSQFRVQMKETPERWEVFGYDAFSVLLEAITKGGRASRRINSSLNSVSGFHGMKGLISFQGSNRVNSEVNLLQFINGKIIKHQVEVMN